jgi:protein ImuB
MPHPALVIPTRTQHPEPARTGRPTPSLWLCLYVADPGLHARDPHGEGERLSRLAAWAQGFTPLVSLEPPRALLLEIRASLRLFGGLKSLLERVRGGLDAQGQRAHMAVAPTPLASLWLARGGQEAVILSPAALRSELEHLPLACLGLDPRLRTRLARTGIHRLHGLWRLPRDGLAQRFGPGLLHTLDRATGLAPDPRTPWQAPYRHTGELELAQEITAHGPLRIAAGRLIGELCEALRERDLGVTRLWLDLLHHRRPPSRIPLETHHSSRDADRLLALLGERLHHAPLSAPVIGLRLISEVAQAFEATPQDLLAHQPPFADPAQRDQDWQRLVERLQARLGRTRIQGLRALADHRPERAWAPAAPGLRNTATPGGTRPLWLLPNPRALPLRDDRPWHGGPLELIGGPERIETGWWDSADIRRDYYIAHAPTGSRLWIFRDLTRSQAWYIHGYFS